MHLIVLIHGFQGYASDLAYLARQIGLEAERRACQDSVHCLLVECNHERTTDSIVTQSQRIVDEISAWIQRQSNNDSIQLSLVGHSLGGVKARCVAKLVASTHPSITLAHYVSVATPHLGSKYSGLVPSPAVELFAGQMGKELVLNDNPTSPLLLQMATDPSYTIPLASFRSRTAYACVTHDPSVFFETAAIRADNPCIFANPTETFGKPLWGMFNSIPILSSKTSTQPRLEDISDLPYAEPSPSRDPNGHVKEILAGLNSMSWTRIAIHPTRPILAHIDCIVKDEYWNAAFGDSVIQDIVQRLFT